MSSYGGYILSLLGLWSAGLPVPNTSIVAEAQHVPQRLLFYASVAGRLGCELRPQYKSISMSRARGNPPSPKLMTSSAQGDGSGVSGLKVCGLPELNEAITSEVRLSG